jgi:hypothetical protein
MSNLYVIHPTTWLPMRLQKYEDPETRITVTGHTAEEIGRTLVATRIQNGHYTNAEEVRQRVIDEICKQAPERCARKTEKTPDGKVRKKFNVEDVRGFIKGFTKDIQKGLVDQKEANRRAGICTSCTEFNMEVAGCNGCNGITNTLYAAIGRKKTYHDSQLKNCGVCGCNLKAKVWCSPEGLIAAEQIQQNKDGYPDHCWVKPIVTTEASQS